MAASLLAAFLAVIGMEAASDGATPPPVIITGVVSEMGAGGAGKGGEETYTLMFSLVAWRAGNGPISTEELRIEQPGFSQAALQDAMGAIDAGKVVKLEVQDLPQTGEHWLLARMLHFLGPADDPELIRTADPILHPLPYDHPVLGRFEADPQSRETFERKIDWLGTPVALSLDREENSSLDVPAATAIALMRDQRGWQARLEAAVIENYYEVWQDNWRDEDEPLLPPHEWFAKMKIDTISVDPDGSFSIWLDDGNLFWGHSICASGTLDSGFTDVRLFG